MAFHLFTLAFGPDRPRVPLELWQVAARAALIYTAGVAVVRFGKGRGIGRITLLDMLLGFMLGPLLAPAITGTDSLSSASLGGAVLVAMYSLITWLSYRSLRFGRLVKGEARIVIDDGVMHKRNMKTAHLSEPDLMEELRLHGVDRLEQVQRAWVERSGAISVVKR